VTSGSAATSQAHSSYLLDSAGIGAWFYGLIGVSLITVLLFPSPAIHFGVAGLFWIVYLYCYVRAPERTILVFVVLFAAMKLIPKGTSPIPAINFETIIIALLAAAALLSRGRQRQPPLHNPLFAPTVYYACLLVLSSVHSYWSGSAQGHHPLLGYYPLPASSIFPTAKNTFMSAFLAPIAFRLVWGPTQLRVVVRLVAWVTIIFSIEAIYDQWDAISAGQVGGLARLEGMWGGNPNLLGGYLAMIVTVYVALLLNGKLKGADRALVLVTLAIAGVALAFTFSRGSWLGAVAGLLYIAVSRGAKSLIAVALLALGLSVWLPAEFVDRFETAVEAGKGFTEEEVDVDRSARTRLVQWGNLPGQWMEAPIIGHGFKAYGKIGGMFTRGGSAKAAHSTIVQMVVEEGLLGLIAYVWLIWGLARGARRVARESDDPFLSALGTGVVAAVICLVLLDCSGTRFPNASVMSYIWILGGSMARMAANLSLEQAQAEPAAGVSSRGPAGTPAERWPRARPLPDPSPGTSGAR
jgi:O-antigen ligase